MFIEIPIIPNGDIQNGIVLCFINPAYIAMISEIEVPSTIVGATKKGTIINVAHAGAIVSTMTLAEVADEISLASSRVTH